MAQSTGVDALKAAISSIRRPYFATGNVPITEPFKLLIAPNATSVSFPASSTENIAPLLSACQQASFGRGQQDVLDPAYRSALVLHAQDFAIAPSSSIEPYTLGIIAAIEHVLFPGAFAFAPPNDVTRPRIVAKLDKLNVYSTGDFFKPHVDTPRSANMFGTLVMNLPVKHEGGQLVIRAPLQGEHVDGDSFETKWGGLDSLGWVAFFSDCMHEVLPVVSGHRWGIFDDALASTLALNTPCFSPESLLATTYS